MQPAPPEPISVMAKIGLSRKGLSILTGVFGGLALLSALQNQVWARASLQAPSWGQSLAHGLTWAAPWFFLTPLILGLDHWIQSRTRTVLAAVAGHGLGLVLTFVPFWALTMLVQATGLMLLKGWSRVAAMRPLQGLLALFLEVPFMYCMVLLASAALRQAWARRQGELQTARLAGQLAEARLNLLQRQLHPHFLFNALQAVSTLLYRDPALADQVLLRLSTLLRSMLEDAGDRKTSLGTELAMTRSYLEIEEIRFQDRLSVHWQIDEQLLDWPTPALVLLPLVENAIRHGLAPKVGPGRLAIRGCRDHGALLLSVEDNGVGAGWPLQPKIGLGNTRERLRALYGEAASLETATPATGGFRAQVRIPARDQRP